MPVQQKKNAAILWSLLFLPLVLISLLNMPVAFANRRSNSAINKNEAAFQQHVIADSTLSEDNNTVANTYANMHLFDLGLSKQAFEYAMKGFNYLLQRGKLANDNIISIVDFSLSSSKKRLFVIDLNEQKVLYNTYVAHGVNSGKEYANQFSNNPSSYQSSLGFYETKSTYLGAHGYSLKLDGLEKGINDNANSRDIVIHAADYVNESLIKTQGYIGRSWGCPALPEKLHKPIIDKIKNGTCLFIYSHNNNYLQKSKIINA
ncbi:MAG: murein L,D-transpeptidase catalytic domain family protein [Ferruginibacter sp.]